MLIQVAKYEHKKLFNNHPEKRVFQLQQIIIITRLILT